MINTGTELLRVTPSATPPMSHRDSPRNPPVVIAMKSTDSVRARQLRECLGGRNRARVLFGASSVNSTVRVIR
jgi:hypothetical protein